MSRRPVTAVVLSAAVLSACGTGLEAQNYRGRTPHDSTSATVEKIAIRGLAVEAPTAGETLVAGGQAIVTGTFVNAGDSADALNDASTDVASTIVLQTATGAPSLAVPAGGSSGTEWSLVLDGLTKELRPGQFISVTLVFAKAGRTTVQIPVRAAHDALEDREVEQDPYGLEHGGAEEHAEG